MEKDFFEYTIYFDRQQIVEIDLFRKSLYKEFCGTKFICLINNYDNIWNMCIAVEYQKRNKLKHQLKKFITKIVFQLKESLICKSFENIDAIEQCKLELVKSFLLSFDKKYDTDFICEKIDMLTMSININSFIYFMLAGINQKWKQLILLTLQNIFAFEEDISIIEFTKFLIKQNGNSKHSLLIGRGKKYYYVKSSGYYCKIVDNDNMIYQIILEITKQMPQKIVVTNCDNLDIRLLSVLRNIMNEKLIIKNKKNS